MYREFMYCRTWMWNISMKHLWQWKKKIWLRWFVNVCACPALNLILDDWKAMVEDLRHPNTEVEIAIAGKYIQLHDAYLSVAEALKHGGIAGHASVKIRWVDSEDITENSCEELLGGVDGILVPGGFWNQGTEEGKILTVKYARENKDSLFGNLSGNADRDH